MDLHEIASMSDKALDDLSQHIRDERERRFNLTFNIKDWPLPTIEQTRFEYLVMIREQYKQTLMDSRLIADRVWKENGR